jgi:selenocysteine-specific elongation factor
MVISNGSGTLWFELPPKEEAREMTRHEIPLVFGTAGHIDHGKTALVRVLTGIDCDRLEEEKRRGITIELGFAPLELPDGTTVSIVDVPGHERFIRQMVAGVSGIDAVLFVVAADEGVMPQTREHLEILQLLGIENGLVALTKIDRVDPEFLELALEDVRGLLKGTFLEGAPIVPVSAVTGAGITELLEQIQKLSRILKPRSSSGAFFLPVDRVFPISGFGTVITGTTYSGELRVGEEVQLLPSGKTARVRSLEVHEAPVEAAFAGQRTAVNLAGIPFKEVRRGDVLCTPNLFKPTQCLDVALKTLKGNREPIKHWQRVRLHIGTSDILCRISFFNPSSKIPPGECDLVQLVLEEPISAAYGQRFVIRSYSPLQTIGGGQVLFPYGWKPRSREKKESYLEMIRQLSSSESLSGRLLAILGEIGVATLERVSEMAQLPMAVLKNTLEGRQLRESIVALSSGLTWLISQRRMETEWALLSERLSQFHEREPHLAGLTLEDALAGLFRGQDLRLSKAALSYFAESGLLRVSENRVSLSGFVPRETSKYENETERVLAFCRKRGFEFPSLEEAQVETGLDRREFSNFLRQLRENGLLHVIGGDLVLSSEMLEKGIEILRKCGDGITLAAFRDLSGTSRKYALPFLEYLDSMGLTRRVGEKRILRQTRL